MGAPGLEPARAAGDLDRVVERAHDLVAGAGRLAPHGHRHAGAVAAGPADRGVDQPGRRRHRAPHQRAVAALDRRGGRASPRARRRPRALRATTSSPEVPLSRRWTMPGRSGWPDVGDLGVPGQQAVDQRAGRVAGARVDHEARRACRRRPGRRPRRRPAPATAGSAARSTSAGASGTSMSTTSPSATRCDRAVHRRRRRRVTAPLVDQRRGLGPAAPGDERDHPVEPLAVERPRHDLAHHARSRPSAPGSPSRHCTTNSRIAPTTIAGVGQVEHRPPLQVDEVDHPAAEEPVAGPERPVDAGCRRPRRPRGRARRP